MVDTSNQLIEVGKTTCYLSLVEVITNLMYVCMSVCMHACMHVCMCMYIYIWVLIDQIITWDGGHRIVLQDDCLHSSTATR